MLCMRPILLFIVPAALISCAMNSSEKASFHYPGTLNSKYAKPMPDTNTLMLIENVSIAYGNLEVQADSALYQRKEKKVTVYGPFNMKFRNEVITVKKTEVVTYSFGDEDFKTAEK